MAVLGKIEKVYDIPKPVRVADEIEFDDEQVLVDERGNDTGDSEHQREDRVPIPAAIS